MWNFSIKFKSINICWSKYSISASSHCLKRQKVYNLSVKYLQKRNSRTKVKPEIKTINRRDTTIFDFEDDYIVNMTYQLITFAVLMANNIPA